MSEEILKQQESKKSVQSKKKNVLKRVLLWGLFIFFLLLLLSSVLGPVLQKASLKSNGPLGELYDVNGKEMHIYCTGEGDQTIVLLSDLLGSTVSWNKLQNNLSRSARVCSYDRAGIAWSEADNGEKSLATMVDDLKTLLSAAGEEGPYLFIGQGFGGAISRKYLMEYPEEVAALFLLDSQARDVMLEYLADDLEDLESLDSSYEKELKHMSLLADLGLLRFLGDDSFSLLNMETYSEEDKALLRLITNNDYWDTVLSDWKIWQDSKNELSHEALLLGMKPISILSADYLENEWPVINDIDMKALYDAQLDAQRELLRLSNSNHLIVLKGIGHDILALAPEDVLDEALSILDVLKKLEEMSNENGDESGLVENEI